MNVYVGRAARAVSGLMMNDSATGVELTLLTGSVSCEWKMAA